MAAVALRDRHDEPQVRVDHPLLRGQVAALDALRQRDLVGGGEQLVPADLREEHAERVRRHGAAAGRKVELEVLFLLGRGQLDATLGQKRLEGGESLLVELVLEHERIELGGLDLSALLGLGRERVQCGNLDDAGLQVDPLSFSCARHRQARAVWGVSEVGRRRSSASPVRRAWLLGV